MTAAEREQGAALLAALLQDPGNAERMLVYADWLDEQGQPALAFAYRWAARRGHWPYVSPAGRSIRWGSLGRYHTDKKTPDRLPPSVYYLLPQDESGRLPDFCDSIPNAFERLASALETLRELLK